ncbi:MAG TPA: ATP-binding cassette domain-containing protein [Solirubrobacteraceae bacterium]|jgi:ABC-2 type transport system ATP-binding protein|nr:ATP-binding cassette domain-containing protein [Solirubrobacteraceae bacterium]
MTSDLTIEATGLEKSYNSTPVVSGISLRVPRAAVFALLGPNGAGKTTTVRMLTTLTTPDGGVAFVAGHDVVAQRAEVRRRISLTGQYAAVDGLQTGAENLRMIGRLQGLSGTATRARASALLERFDLVEAGGRRVTTYSGGMRRRLDLAASLMRPPRVLFLDEPTAGLDPRSRRALWSVVGSLVSDGVTVFLTTQYLDEADALADRIAVLDRGRIVAEGSAAELKAAVAGRRLVVRAVDGAACDAVARAAGARVVERNPGLLTLDVACEGEGAAVRALLDELDPDRSRIADFSVRSASLDDVFLTLTGHTATVESESTDD